MSLRRLALIYTNIFLFRALSFLKSILRTSQFVQIKLLYSRFNTKPFKMVALIEAALIKAFEIIAGPDKFSMFSPSFQKLAFKGVGGIFLESPSVRDKLNWK